MSPVTKLQQFFFNLANNFLRLSLDHLANLTHLLAIILPKNAFFWKSVEIVTLFLQYSDQNCILFRDLLTKTVFFCDHLTESCFFRLLKLFFLLRSFGAICVMSPLIHVAFNFSQIKPRWRQENFGLETTDDLFFF